MDCPREQTLYPEKCQTSKLVHCVIELAPDEFVAMDRRTST